MSISNNKPSIKLGSTGPEVFPLGLGCMAMSGMYGPSDEAESIATLHAALERGVNLLDTGDFYGTGHNELLIARALAGQRNQALVSVKFGALRAPGGGWVGVDCRPAAIKNFLAYTLTRLGTDYVDIYRPARLDPSVPIEDTVGAMAELVKAGYVRHIGLSEVGVETIRRAHAVHPICDLQIEYSLLSRSAEAKIFPALEELGIGVTAYGVLSRGLLSGSKPTGQSDFRAYLPRFTGDNAEQNRKLAQELARIAQELGHSPAAVATAWVRARRGVLPLSGARTRAQLAQSLEALEVEWTPELAQRLEAAVPASAVVGTRYAEQQMQHLDSER